MKTLTILFVILLSLIIKINAQVIDHSCINLEDIPKNYIDSAKANLHIGYGHTSHGSQITTGMNALEEYFTDGTYNWSHSGGENELHLYEGDGYGDGDLDHDIGYSGWDDETREYLNSNPQCNVIIWSWCGQVNSVDLQSHLFNRMEQLENDFPNVIFVYMTGHLEGLGADGSLYTANQQIRDYCIENNKFLFDFADIEKYDPDSTQNYMNNFADDECNYDPDGEEPINRSENWATNWLSSNSEHELAKISDVCGSCAHSQSLNCVKKGIAAWYLWAMLAGWQPDDIGTGINKKYVNKNSVFKFNAMYNQTTNDLGIKFQADNPTPINIHVYSITGQEIYTHQLRNVTLGQNVINLPMDIPRGLFIVKVNNKHADGSMKIIN